MTDFSDRIKLAQTRIDNISSSMVSATTQEDAKAEAKEAHEEFSKVLEKILYFAKGTDPKTIATDLIFRKLWDLTTRENPNEYAYELSEGIVRELLGYDL